MRKQFGKDFTAMTPKVKYLVKKKRIHQNFLNVLQKISSKEVKRQLTE